MIGVGFSLATFNVKNLLEPRDEGEQARLPERLEALGALLRDCDADVVGLQEVGSIELVRSLAARSSAGRAYGDAFVGGADARGIRCALLSRIGVLAARVHAADSLTFPVFREGDPLPFGSRIPLRRGVVHAQVLAPGIGPVDVLVGHFKSALPVALRDASGNEIAPASVRARSEGALRSVVWRAAEALFVRGLVDEILAAGRGAHVAVMGDFNDVPESLVLNLLRGEGEGALFDCTRAVAPATRFSVFHDGRPMQIDHVLATANLFGRVAKARFVNADLRDHGAFELGGVEEPQTVDSDHAPLVVRFE
jgi:endonuclease/exonuclease/phosphatase family metal-dependent hydrolase